jgi:hypothetical protein
VLIPEENIIHFAHINLLIVHTKTGHNLLRLVQVFRYVMLRWDEMKNQFDDVIVALTQETVL